MILLDELLDPLLPGVSDLIEILIQGTLRFICHRIIVFRGIPVMTGTTPGNDGKLMVIGILEEPLIVPLQIDPLHLSSSHINTCPDH